MLKIVGAADGEVLRRAGAAPLLRLTLLGPRDEINWMVNGTLVARTAPGDGYAHRFTTPGRYEITALDDAGGYDRIGLSVR